MPQEQELKQNKPLIFFDVDGVLADFVGHAERGGKVNPDKSYKYDMMDYNWWATMPVFPGAKECFDAADKLGETRFLTGPVLNEDCYSGKARWVQNFVPEGGTVILKKLIICRARDKHLLAAPDRILVDDTAGNIKRWEDAGGIGVHHTGDFSETLKKLKEAVAKIATNSQPAPAQRQATARRHSPGMS